ncbi:hypothetical protein SARC_05388 [Sphaeroforma arctica JP610]|uniref:Uncharacterized protein n=1 Tax=Sphaeroforma arctica JP610 TaxID=667725 RepID=A0A0L0G0E1_9EUKA|nr:hypothetical protein SARC_05388 [Sphaeroforma arctica JP610]KNC82324.1 hypothetical protein SARC_05388 [Sphaeroforma arctica JP610]|eukprot:XP_014156226.1 hypothetical protein SARC_05388 [Sphaeroforma arctica JP610]
MIPFYSPPLKGGVWALCWRTLNLWLNPPWEDLERLFLKVVSDKVVGVTVCCIGFRQDNASDKGETTPSREKSPEERARGPNIASTLKLAFTKPRSEIQGVSKDTPANPYKESQKEVSLIAVEDYEPQRVPPKEHEEEKSSNSQPESKSKPTESTRRSMLTAENTELKNQLSALKQSLAIEHVDRMYGSGENPERFHEHLSPGTTKALQKWTECKLEKPPSKR